MLSFSCSYKITYTSDLDFMLWSNNKSHLCKRYSNINEFLYAWNVRLSWVATTLTLLQLYLCSHLCHNTMILNLREKFASLELIVKSCITNILVNSTMKAHNYFLLNYILIPILTKLRCYALCLTKLSKCQQLGIKCKNITKSFIKFSFN